MKTQTTTTTVSRSNQTAVPTKVRTILDIEAGDKLVWTINSRKKTILLKPSPKKWGAYMRDLGKEIWQKENTDKYLEKLRRDRNLDEQNS